MKLCLNLAGRLMVLMPLLLVLIWSRAIFAVSLEEIPQKVWEIGFEDDNLEYEYKDAAMISKDSIWLAVGVRPKGQLGGDQGFSLWRVDLNHGKKVNDINLEDFSKGQEPKIKYTKIQDLAVTENGELLLVLESLDNQVSLVKVDSKNGENLFIKKIGEAHSGVLIMKIIQTADRKYLLIGRASDKPLMMKVDERGNTIWKKTIDDENLSIFLDGLLTDDNGYALIGTYITSSGESNFWLGKFDSNGDLFKKNIFNGRYGNIVKAKDNGYAVVHNQMGSKGWNIFIRGINPDLSGSWNAELLSGVEVFSPFKIASASNGDYIVAGSGESRLSVSRIKKGGEVLWNHIRRDNSTVWEKLWNFDLLSQSGEFVIPYTMLIVNKQGEQRQVIKIMKFLEN